MNEFSHLLESFKLDAGRHARPEKGLCVMEAVAWLEGMPHSDRPECTCPVIAECVSVLNDWMDDDTRQALIPYLPKLAATASMENEWPRAEYAVLFAANRSLPLLSDRIGFDPSALRAARTLDDAAEAVSFLHGHIIWRGMYTRFEALRLAPFVAGLRTSLRLRDRTGMAGASAAAVVVTAGMLKDFAPCFDFLDGLLAIAPGAGLSPEAAARPRAYKRMAHI